MKESTNIQEDLANAIYGENEFVAKVIRFFDAIYDFFNKYLGRRLFGNQFSPKEAKEDLINLLDQARSFDLEGTRLGEVVEKLKVKDSEMSIS